MTSASASQEGQQKHKHKSSDTYTLRRAPPASRQRRCDCDLRERKSRRRVKRQDAPNSQKLQRRKRRAAVVAPNGTTAGMASTAAPFVGSDRARRQSRTKPRLPRKAGAVYDAERMAERATTKASGTTYRAPTQNSNFSTAMKKNRNFRRGSRNRTNHQ